MYGTKPSWASGAPVTEGYRTSSCNASFLRAIGFDLSEEVATMNKIC